ENGGWSCGFNNPGKGSCTFEEGKAVIDIENSGDENWHIQLQQSGIKLQKGHHYRFSADAVASVDRGIEVSVLDPDNNWA
ncbi:MAG: carbohydrate binding domain-containing protein, partial [Pseudobutyrivibrio sp.]|nr:carbohydrate binding domain-containing protein [Pseudobutyrivibrio sp.]